MRSARPSRDSVCLVALALMVVSCEAMVADAAPPAARKPAAAQARLGMNLNGPADWNTELPFVDVFRLSRPWISQAKGQPWGKGPALDLDEHGWVKRLAPQCWAETPVCTIDGGHYPSGKYTVLYEGKGTLDFSNSARIV